MPLFVWLVKHAFALGRRRGRRVLAGPRRGRALAQVGVDVAAILGAALVLAPLSLLLVVAYGARHRRFVEAQARPCATRSS